MKETDAHEQWFSCGRGHNFKVEVILETQEKIQGIRCPRCDQIVHQRIGKLRDLRRPLDGN